VVHKTVDIPLVIVIPFATLATNYPIWVGAGANVALITGAAVGGGEGGSVEVDSEEMGLRAGVGEE
jgi:hypothetical protein